MPIDKPTIIILDDEKGIVETFKNMCPSKFEVIGTTTIEQFNAQKNNQYIVVAVIDERMPMSGISGIEILCELKEQRPDITRILLTAYGDANILEGAINKAKVFHYIEKGSDRSKFLQVLDQAFELYQRNKGAIGFYSIIGKSKTIKDVIDKARKAAGSNIPITIYGETGTGKEILAQAIHYASGRCFGPYFPINCGIIRGDLVATCLFGYVKGAFTGANKDTPGYFEQAKGGTLFLDEIGEISQDMQLPLLRALQEKKIRRVGSNIEIPIDVRVIAATHKSLLSEIEVGNFRRDLYYRLQGVELTIPPLRDRREDIPMLVHYFLSKNEEAREKRVSTISDRAIETLTNFEFRGNIRELENAIKRAVVYANETIELENLPEYMTKDKVDENNHSLSVLMDQCERNIISQALNRAEWDVAKTALELGVTPRTIYNKIKKYKLRQ